MKAHCRGFSHDTTGLDHGGLGVHCGCAWFVVPLGPNARVSLVVSPLQAGRIDHPISSRSLYLRREHAGGQFLQEVRQLEHVAGAVPALCRLFLEGTLPRGRISLRYEQVEDAQSESSAIAC
jgi:hypothetical protein